MLKDHRTELGDLKVLAFHVFAPGSTSANEGCNMVIELAR
jgi:hypothetical protein